jgi:hypothetical protein
LAFRRLRYMWKPPPRRPRPARTPMTMPTMQPAEHAAEDEEETDELIAKALYDDDEEEVSSI